MEIAVSWDDGGLTIAAEHEDDARGQRKTDHRRFRFPKPVDDEIEVQYTTGSSKSGCQYWRV